MAEAHDPSDEEIVRRIRDGDAAAAAVLFDRHAPALRAAAQRGRDLGAEPRHDRRPDRVVERGVERGEHPRVEADGAVERSGDALIVQGRIAEVAALRHEADSARFAQQAAGRRLVPEPELVAGTKSSNAAGGDVGRDRHRDGRAARGGRDRREVAGRGRPGELTTAEREELGRLRRENQTLRQEREILKKAAAFFAKETTR
jgi:transposase